MPANSRRSYGVVLVRPLAPDQIELHGRAVVEELQPQIDTTNEKVLAPLSPNERDEFLRLLQRLT